MFPFPFRFTGVVRYQTPRFERIIFLVACVAFARAALGDTRVPPDKATTLPPVVILAPATVTPALEASSLTTFDREALFTSSKTDLDPVLRGQPGVTLGKANRGNFSAVSLRGVGSGFGQLVLDGIPLFGAVSQVTGGYLLDTFAPEMLDEVKIVRGASAPHYGSQALGGVMLLSTRDAREDGAFLHLRGGSFDTMAETGGASLAGRLGRATLTVKHEDILDGAPVADPANGNHERSELGMNLVSLRFATQPTDPFAIDGSLYHTDVQASTAGIGFLPGGLLAAVDDKNGLQRTEGWIAQTTLRASLAEAWESSLKLGFVQDRTRLRLNFLGLTDLEGLSETRLLLARWQNAHPIFKDRDAGSGLRFTWGGEARQEEGNTTSLVLNVEETRAQFAGFADLEASLGSWRGFLGTRTDQYDRFGAHAVFYGGLAWKASSTWTLRGSGGTGYRIPSFRERFLPFFGNPDLLPEHGKSGDIGVDWTPSNSLKISVSGFYNRFDNLIYLAFDPTRGLQTSSNIPHTRIHGLEFQWKYDLNRAFSLEGSYTYLEGRDLDARRVLPHIPKHQGRFYGSWRPSELPLHLSLEGIYRRDYFDDRALRLRLDDAVQLNAQIGYTVSPAIEIYLRGENLTDNRTPQGFSFGVPGLGAYAGLRMTLK